jgi:hypothetical protein
MKLLRSDDQVDIRKLIQQRGAAVLRHAAEYPQNKVGLASFAALLTGGVGNLAGGGILPFGDDEE